jgi:hypothetical protein
MALFATGAIRGRRQPIVVPRPILSGAVGDMSASGMSCQGRGSRRGVPAPLMTSGAWPRTRAITFVVVGGKVGPFGICTLGEAELVPLRSSESEPTPLGQAWRSPRLRGQGVRVHAPRVGRGGARVPKVGRDRARTPRVGRGRARAPRVGQGGARASGVERGHGHAP